MLNRKKGNFRRSFNSKFDNLKIKYKNDPKKKLVTFLALFGLFCCLIGSSYAYLTYVSKTNNSTVISAGTFSMVLKNEANSITMDGAVPVSDEYGLKNSKVYSFDIENTGNISARYVLSLDNVCEVGKSYYGTNGHVTADVCIPDQYIKVAISLDDGDYTVLEYKDMATFFQNTDDEELVADKYVLSADLMGPGEVRSYKMMIWLDYDTPNDYNSLGEKNVVYAGKLGLTYEQGGYDTSFSYTGDYQEYTVEKTGLYYIELGGARGGRGHKNGELVDNYGRGAKSTGYVNLEKGEKLYFYVGGVGGDPVAMTCTNTTAAELAGTGGAGGWNGGGAGGNDSCSATNAANDAGGGGGGATDVRLVSGAWNDKASLISRIMVAAGGGGGTYTYGGGHGGTINGTVSFHNPDNESNISQRSSQISGYAFGEGAPGEYCSDNIGSGGHGGGYYGGQFSVDCSTAASQGGTGGASFISGYAGVNAVTDNATVTHSYQTLHYSDKYFIGGLVDEGGNIAGDGYAKISYVGTVSTSDNDSLESVRYIKDCSSFNSYNNYNQWTEIQAIKDGVNVAKGKTVTGTTTENASRPYSLIVDGDLTVANYSTGSSQTENQCVTIDLGNVYDLDEVAVWNYIGSSRSYFDSVTYVSSDNSNWKPVINEAFIAWSSGKRISKYKDVYNGYIQDGLVLWYDGYANSGNSRDPVSTIWKNMVSNSYTGTVNGATWSTSDISGLQFDGVDDYVSIAEVNPSNLTVEIVYKKDSFLSEQRTTETLIANYQTGGYGISYEEDFDKIATTYYVNGSYNYLADYLVLGQMGFVSTSYNGTTGKLYTNGKFVSEDTYGSAITSPTNSTILMLGANPKGTIPTDSFYKGDIFSIRIYDRELTSDEVKHNYMYDVSRYLN